MFAQIMKLRSALGLGSYRFPCPLTATRSPRRPLLTPSLPSPPFPAPRHPAQPRPSPQVVLCGVK
ncbi:hypothetical protein E2C01_087327 [Portunus trituberculatus]|uniref:Uncharacterized protein n=1 Tax=Portunus trituberculatus TaxID=210409 RepID=A0A5B7JBK7_PORTR|nr:hypothetical protein [Portunus trituberculatus]